MIFGVFLLKHTIYSSSRVRVKKSIYVKMFKALRYEKKILKIITN